jgi:putative ABC transport system permease protein
MKALDVIEYTFSNFSNNKFKTMMSSLGIIIGVMAIVTMLALGDGIYSGVSQQFGSLDLNQIIITPGQASGGMLGLRHVVSEPPATFTARDVSQLANTPGVTEVNPRIITAGTVTSNGENESLSINGVVPSTEKELSQSIGKGRFLSPSDTYAVVIGSNVSSGTFKNDIMPGMTITITSPLTGMSHQYTVAGVLQESNGSIVTGDPNSNIYMTTAGILGISNDTTYSEILVRASSVNTVQQTADAITTSLNRLHHNEGFTVTTVKSFSDAITSIFSYITDILGGIAAISLVVGGIGILNVMMLTVKERTKEIGLMKAVGATTGNVRLLFLMESSMLGIVSGIIGLGLAYIITYIIGLGAGFSMPISLQNIIIGIGFGFITTTIAGVYPANQAAKLDPIEALRTE